MNGQNDALRTASLLATKVYAPRVRPGLVPRVRLTARLEESLSCSLTLLSAPPGFGKTTLLSEWIAQSRKRVAWLSLDEADNDPVRFWTYVIAALQTIDASLGTNALALLPLQHSGQLSVGAVLTSLIDDLTCLSHPEDIILALDDYHLIKNPTIHDALNFLIDHQPAQLHLVICTRADPSLPLARRRARGELAELRAMDLRFTPEEAAEFLNRMMGLNLTEQEIAALEAHTEGWIAGLQLAALSMQNHRDSSEFIAAFTGSNRYILDYLVEEVLQRQSEEVQSFLSQTCILTRLTGPLCDVVTARSDSQAVLEQLERANLFIIPLDDERCWYRYHHLFAEFLRHHLRRNQPGRIPELLQRASHWCEQNGFVTDAVNYALAAKDIERAAVLVEQNARAFVMHGELGAVVAWMNALPEELIRNRPTLCLERAWTILLSAGPHDNMVESLLQAAERSLGPGGDNPSTLCQVIAIRANIACDVRDIPQTIQLSRQGLELLTPQCEWLRGPLLLTLAGAHSMSGNVMEASRVFEQAVRANQEAQNSLAAFYALHGLARQHFASGALHRAVQTYQRALDLMTLPNGRALPFASLAYLGIAEVDYEWNQLNDLQQHLKCSLELAQEWCNAKIVAQCQLLAARLAIARKDWYLALTEIDQASASDSLSPSIAPGAALSPDVQALAASCRVRLWLGQGNLQAASEWARQCGLKASNECDYLHEAAYLALARLRIAESRHCAEVNGHSEALHLLKQLRDRARRQGRIRDVIEILSLESLALDALGDRTKALSALRQALSLAEPEGFIRIFLDEAEPMQALVRDAYLDSPSSKDHILKLLAGFAEATEHSERSTVESPSVNLQLLVEPLSERELELLKLIASGHSNREIADRLALTVGTVKWHITNILSKLDAHNRVEAVARARELKLIP